MTDSPEVSVSTKRARSSKGKGRRHASQAESMTDVASALLDIGSALSSSGALATPMRRKRAIQLVDEDAEYSSDEEDMIINMFTDNIAYADTYTSIPKKNRRVKFIRGRLQKSLDLTN